MHLYMGKSGLNLIDSLFLLCVPLQLNPAKRRQDRLKARRVSQNRIMGKHAKHSSTSHLGSLDPSPGAPKARSRSARIREREREGKVAVVTDPRLEMAQVALEKKIGGEYKLVYPCSNSGRQAVYTELIEKAHREFFDCGRGMRVSNVSLPDAASASKLQARASLV